MTKYNLKSPYVRFAKLWCDKMGLFHYNEISKKREYAEEDIWEGILLMAEHERKNRKGN